MWGLSAGESPIDRLLRTDFTKFGHLTEQYHTVRRKGITDITMAIVK